MSDLTARAQAMADAASESLSSQIDRINMDATDPYYRESRDNWAELIEALATTKVVPFVRGDLYGVEMSACDLTDLYTQTALDAAGAANSDAGDPVLFTASAIAYR